MTAHDDSLIWDDDSKRLFVGYFADGREAWFTITASNVVPKRGSKVSPSVKERIAFYPGVSAVENGTKISRKNISGKSLDFDKVVSALKIGYKKGEDTIREQYKKIEEAWKTRYGEWLEQELAQKLEKLLAVTEEEEEERDGHATGDSTLAEDSSNFFSPKKYLTLAEKRRIGLRFKELYGLKNPLPNKVIDGLREYMLNTTKEPWKSSVWARFLLESDENSPSAPIIPKAVPFSPATSEVIAKIRGLEADTELFWGKKIQSKPPITADDSVQQEIQRLQEDTAWFYS